MMKRKRGRQRKRWHLTAVTLLSVAFNSLLSAERNQRDNCMATVSTLLGYIDTLNRTEQCFITDDGL